MDRKTLAKTIDHTVEVLDLLGKVPTDQHVVLQMPIGKTGLKGTQTAFKIPVSLFVAPYDRLKALRFNGRGKKPLYIPHPLGDCMN